MTLKRQRTVFILPLSLMVTSACQFNSGISATQASRHREAEIPTSGSIRSNPSQIENRASSCVVNSSPQSVSFPPLPEPLFVTQIQKTHPVGSNFGIGFLVERREERSDSNHAEWNPGYEWLSHLRLPLYDAPHGNAWGWIACGWLVDLSSSKPQISRLEPSLLQTSYETFSFIVLNEQSDGWFQFRYGLPTLSHRGVAWAYTSHLRLGDRPLRIQYWKDIFQPSDVNQRNNRGWLQFRDHAPSSDQRLRRESTPTSEVSFPTDGTFLEGDYGIEPIEIQGNWMRVRISIPQDYCKTHSEPIEFHEGWIQWWTPEQGTLLYYHPRGC